jgi:hypothetical protein
VIDQGDIEILREGVVKVAVTPFVALFGMFCLSSIKSEFSKSSSFAYQIKGAQDKMMTNDYGRKGKVNTDI